MPWVCHVHWRSEGTLQLQCTAQWSDALQTATSTLDSTVDFKLPPWLRRRLSRVLAVTSVLYCTVLLYSKLELRHSSRAPLEHLKGTLWQGGCCQEPPGSCTCGSMHSPCLSPWQHVQVERFNCPQSTRVSLPAGSRMRPVYGTTVL